ncbi:MAG: NUDIX domain-containing protein [Anaerolineaceae bacterium]|nr:NUDIX domain-containing protein [Anaerolineaceae bacterium]
MRSEDQGCTISRYSVIPRVLIFVINSNDQVLLLKGASNKKLWSGKWNGLGGHVEEGEDLISAAKRELWEESGIISEDVTLCGVVMINTGTNPGVCMFVYRADYGSGDLKNSDEGELKWVDFGELGNYNLVDDVSILLSKIITHKAENKVFYALYEFDENDQLVVKFY